MWKKEEECIACIAALAAEQAEEEEKMMEASELEVFRRLTSILIHFSEQRRSKQGTRRVQKRGNR